VRVRTCTIHPAEHLLGQVGGTGTEGLVTSVHHGGRGEPGTHPLPELKMEKKLLQCILLHTHLTESRQ